VRRDTKTTQLQVRLTPAEKRQIERDARAAGVSVSEWVLLRLIRRKRDAVRRVMDRLAAGEDAPSYALADLHDLLASLSPEQLEADLVDAPPQVLGPLLRNQIAAMVEVACHAQAVEPPAWTLAIAPLAVPWFASDLLSARLDLLTQSPPPFRRRNLFVDASIGARV
jgi:hypothetical protein